MGEVAEAIAASRYETLRDSYLSESDGCSVSSDGPFLSVDVEADGNRKQIRRYAGCEGVPDAKRVDVLISAILAATETAEWTHGPLNCGYVSSLNPTFAPSYRLDRAGATLGILTMSDPPAPRATGSWELRDCAMQPIAHGRTYADATRRMLVAEQDAPLMVAGLGDIGSIVLSRRAGDPAITAQALTVSTEISLALTEGAPCP